MSFGKKDIWESPSLSRSRGVCMTGASVFIGQRLKRPHVTYDNVIGMNQYHLWDSEVAKKEPGFTPRPLRQERKVALSS